MRKLLLKIVKELAELGVKSITFSVRGTERIATYNNRGKFSLIKISDLKNYNGYSLSENYGKIVVNKIKTFYSHKANSKLIKIITSGGYNGDFL